MITPLGWAVRLAVGILLAVVCLMPLGCQPKSADKPADSTGPQIKTVREPVVRVLLLANQSSITLSSAEPPTFRIGQGPQRPVNLRGSTRVTYGAGGWNIGGSVVGSGELTIVPAVGRALGVNGSSYRGNIRFIADNNSSTFDVINDVRMDDYLMSVVSRELYSNFHPQAFEAQAIAARTYALYEIATTPPAQRFDVFDDTRSQVYGGLGSETTTSREAVDRTRGVVLGFGPRGQEKVFKTYFSATCGGIGQNSQDAFSELTIPPLMEKNVGTQCSISPRYSWGPVTVSKAEITRRMRLFGQRRGRAEANIANVQRVEIAATNRFGRPSRFVITDSRGSRYSLLAEELRNAMNIAGQGTTLWSSFVTPVDAGPAVRFENGRGHGHGVGMCQWCVQAQALKGVPHEQILLSAYPGSRLIRAY